jgi:uncharacterized protein YdeI (YjbR/CyaY-like superfamily)
MAPVTFNSPAQFRKWLERNGSTATEVVLALAKKGSGLKTLTYRQALDEALCFGWIDGVTHRIDDRTYSVRFTPRRARSYWSDVNLRRYKELESEGRIAPPGRARYEARDPQAEGRYSFENRPKRLAPALLRRFKQHTTAWTFFTAQPPGYRRLMIFWIMSAVKDETRERRLALLMADSAAGRRVDVLSPRRRDNSS